MKKLGLLSVAAAVALSSSAFAGEVKLSADATVTGESVKHKLLFTEGKEWYNLEVNLGIEMKNDDGITLKAGYVLYDNIMGAKKDGAAGLDEQAMSNATQPTLDYGYIIAPLGDLTLKSGFVEAGPFGTDFTNSGSSAFKPFALNYKVAGLNIGLEEIMTDESAADNKNGGTIGSAGDNEISASRVYVKGKVDTLGWGARTTITQYGEGATIKTGTTATKAVSKNQTELYVAGDVAGLNVAAHYVTVSGDDEVVAKANNGLYAHVLVPMGNLTAGVAIANLNDGFKSGAEFDPSIIVDKVLKDGQIESADGENTQLTVIPVIFKVSDTITVDARLVSGKLYAKATTTAITTAESYSETNANLTYALGKVTNLKLSYATGSGDAVGGEAVTYTGWSLSTAF